MSYIAIDIRCLLASQPTGVALYTVGLLDALLREEQKHTYILFSSGVKPLPEEYRTRWSGKARFVHFRFPNKLLHLILALRLVSVDWIISKLVGKKIDIFFVPNIHILPVSTQVKFVATIHDLSFEHLPEVFSWKRRLWHWVVQPKKIAKRADVVVTPSHYTAWDVARTYKIDKNKIQPVVAALTQLESREEVVDITKPYILCLGTIEPRKNIDALVQAYKKSELFEQGIRFVIAGVPGWQCVKTLEHIGNTEGVEHLGYVSPAEKNHLYKQALCFIYPSLYEGFGLPILEAMVHGTPVITSHVTALTEVGGDAVHYVNPDDMNDIAHAMKILCSDMQLRERYSEKGKERAQTYTWKKSAAILRKVFSEV